MAAVKAAGSSGADQDALDRAHDAQRLDLRRSHGKRVEAILRPERVAGLGAPEGGRHDPPGAIARLQDIIDIDRLMGAVEGSHPEMHDPRDDRRTVIGGPVDARRQPLDGRIR
jgi:hypothetical protein